VERLATKLKKKKSKDFTIINPSKIITYYLALIMIVGLFFDGYFFTQQILAVNFLTGTFFVVMLVIYHKNNMSLYYDKKFLLLGLGFLIVNIISLFFASNVREALESVLVVVNALLVFLLAIQAFKEENNIIFFLKYFYWSVVIVGIIGLTSYIFGIDILNSFRSGRLYSTLGYANTAALAFIMAFFIGFLLISKAQKNSFIYFFTNASLILSFIGTKSRGVFLLFPVLLLFFIIVTRKEERLKIIKNLLLTLVPSIILSPLIYMNSYKDRTIKEIILSVICLVILFAFYYLIKRFNLNRKTLIVSSLIITLIIIGISSSFFNSKINTLTYSDVFKRFKQISFREQSVQERFIFMKDALKIARDNLLFGVGGGGWDAEYKQYRTFLYYTKEVHNNYFQVLVENGILGFSIYLTLWGFSIFGFYRMLKGNRNLLNISLATILLSIFLHSFIDFDLTYLLFYMLLWILFAISTNKESYNTYKSIDNRKLSIVISAFVIIVIFINGSLFMGWAYGDEATKCMANREISKAIDNFEKSTIFDPINSTNLSRLSQLYYINGTNKKSEVNKEKAFETNEKAIRYNTTNPEWYIIKSKFQIEIGKYEDALQTSLKAISLAPFEETIYYNTASFFIVKDTPETMKYAKNILKIAKDEGAKIEQNEYKKWWHGTKLSQSPKLAFLEGKIKFHEEDYENAKVYYYQAIRDKSLKDEAIQQLNECYSLSENLITNGQFNDRRLSGWVYNGKDGKKREIIKENNRYWMNISKDAVKTASWGIRQEIFDYEPNQAYKLSFEGYSKNQEGKLQIVIHQVGKDGNKPAISKILDINEQKEYTYQFETGDQKNKEKLRIYFLVPSKAEANEIYITNIRLIKID